MSEKTSLHELIGDRLAVYEGGLKSKPKPKPKTSSEKHELSPMAHFVNLVRDSERGPRLLSAKHVGANESALRVAVLAVKPGYFLGRLGNKRIRSANDLPLISSFPVLGVEKLEIWSVDSVYGMDIFAEVLVRAFSVGYEEWDLSDALARRYVLCKRAEAEEFNLISTAQFVAQSVPEWQLAIMQGTYSEAVNMCAAHILASWRDELNPQD